MGGSWLFGTASDATVDQIEKPKGENNQWWDFMDLFPDSDKKSKETNINKVKSTNQWWDFMDWIPDKEKDLSKVESISHFPSYDDKEVEVKFVTLPPQVVPFSGQSSDGGESFPIVMTSFSDSDPYESLYAGGLYG